MHLRNLKYFLFFIFCFVLLVLTSYQDSPLAEIFGEIAKSPVFFLFPFFVLFDFIFSSKYKSTQTYLDINKIFNLFILFFLFSSLINLTYWFVFKGGSMSYLGENVVLKCFKVLLYYVFFLYLFKFFYISFNFFSSLNLLSTLFLFFNIFLLLILIIEIIQMPYAFEFLHLEPTPYYRVRLFTSESSYTGAVVIFSVSSILYLSKNKFHILFAILFFIVYAVSTRSKMFLSVLPISFIVLNIMNAKKIKLKFLIILFLASSIILYFLGPFVISLFAEDLDEYTSTITRTASFLSGIFISITHPVGTAGLYFYYLIEQLPRTINYVISLFMSDNTSELDSWGITDDKFISAGSTFAEWGMLLGPFGIYLYLRLIKVLYKSSNSNVLHFVIIYFTITSFFSENIITRLTWAIFFALASIKRTNDSFFLDKL